MRTEEALRLLLMGVAVGLLLMLLAVLVAVGRLFGPGFAALAAL
jgi:hypothetical protein